MKKFIVAILIPIFVLTFCACGGATADSAAQPDSAAQESEKEAEVNATIEETVVEADRFDLDAYKESASDFRTEAYAASVILANMGNYETNYWKALGTLSDSMVDKAFTWLAENSDESQETVEADYESIRAAYKELILTDFGDNAEAAEIDAGVRALYDGYSELYDTILNPSGSRGHFASHVSDLISEIQSANNDLLHFLPEEAQ